MHDIFSCSAVEINVTEMDSIYPNTECKQRVVFMLIASELNSALIVKASSIFICFCRPNSFVIITANRVLHCNADTPEEMHHWITLLQRSKGDTRVEGQEFIVRGKNQVE